MNSLRKSVGKYFHFGAHGLVLITLVGCATSKQSSRPGEASRQVKDALSGEISLKSDRAALEELRKDIPEQKKQSNDELALVLELFGTVKLPPSEVQGKYQIAMQKRREIFRKKMSEVRNRFEAQQDERRLAFLKAHAEEREAFSKNKADRDKTRAFYANTI